MSGKERSPLQHGIMDCFRSLRGKQQRSSSVLSRSVAGSGALALTLAARRDATNVCLSGIVALKCLYWKSMASSRHAAQSNRAPACCSSWYLAQAHGRQCLGSAPRSSERPALWGDSWCTLILD